MQFVRYFSLLCNPFFCLKSYKTFGNVYFASSEDVEISSAGISPAYQSILLFHNFPNEIAS